MTENQIEPTKAQRTAGNIAAGAYVILCGVFLLLVGLGVFDGLTIGNVTLISIFYTLALAFMTGAFIQKNTAVDRHGVCGTRDRNASQQLYRAHLRATLSDLYRDSRNLLRGNHDTQPRLCGSP